MNAAGVQDDVNSRLKAFLDYVAGRESEDSFVQRLEEAVSEAKKLEQLWNQCQDIDDVEQDKLVS